MVARKVKDGPAPLPVERYRPPCEWPFPQWKDGEMVVKKLRMPTKKEQLKELPEALM